MQQHQATPAQPPLEANLLAEFLGRYGAGFVGPPSRLDYDIEQALEFWFSPDGAEH
jgi:hypothetical protein